MAGAHAHGVLAMHLQLRKPKSTRAHITQTQEHKSTHQSQAGLAMFITITYHRGHPWFRSCALWPLLGLTWPTLTSWQACSPGSAGPKEKPREKDGSRWRRWGGGPGEEGELAAEGPGGGMGGGAQQQAFDRAAGSGP